MPRNEYRPPPTWEPTPKGYNTERVTSPLDLDSNARNPQQYSALQKSMDRLSLLSTASRIFIEQLGMPLLADWGITPTGNCTCGGRKKSRRPSRPGDPPDRDCRMPGKHPAVRVANGRSLYEYATLGTATADSWIARGNNLAAIPVGHVVIDIDGTSGLRAFVTWCELAGLNAESMLYDTLVVRSGSGTGLHLYYRLPEREKPPVPHDGWLPKVDFKTTGRSHSFAKRSSKATIPGSLHWSLNRYEFATFNDPVVIPDVLLEALRAGRAYDADQQRILAPGEAVAYGSSIGFGSSLPPEYEPFIRAHPPVRRIGGVR